VIIDMLIAEQIKFDDQTWPVWSEGDADEPSDVLVRWPLPNVWPGVSVEDQPRADERIPDLLATPAALHFISAEPLLGPLDLNKIKAPRSPDEPADALEVDWYFDALEVGDYYWFDCGDGYTEPGDGPYRENRIGLVILGGENGPRPLHPDWPRALRDQCAAATLHGDEAPVPFFFKQWGSCLPGNMDGEDEHGRAAYEIEDVAQPVDYDQLGRGRLIQAHGCDFIQFPHHRTGRMLDGVEHNAIPTP